MDLLCQNWPMKVSKDQHFKAERKCLSDAWNNLRISHIHVFLKNLDQHVPRKINMKFAKVRRKNFFGEDGVFQMKEFRTTLI